MKKFTTSTALALPAWLCADTEITRSAMGGSNMSMFVMLGLALVFFYFIILRPERKRRKKMEEKRNSMRKGDQITTTTGIRGTVHKVESDTVVVNLYDGAKMELLKQAIMEIQPPSGGKAAEASS